MRNLFGVLFVSLILFVFYGSGAPAAPPASFASPAIRAGERAPAASGTPQSPLANISARKLIKDAKVILRVSNAAQVANDIRQSCQMVDGFVANSGLTEDAEGKTAADIEVKIPAQALDPFLNKVAA